MCALGLKRGAVQRGRESNSFRQWEAGVRVRESKIGENRCVETCKTDPKTISLLTLLLRTKHINPFFGRPALCKERGATRYGT